MKEYGYLFNYLETENIKINKEEFTFQVQSHPDYPSLLALSDTLSFFKINHYAASVSKDEISKLPECFVAYLSVELSEPTMFFVKKESEKFYKLQSKNNDEIINRKELENRWRKIILLAEAPENYQAKNDSKSKTTVFTSVFMIVFLGLVYYFSNSLIFTLFSLLPVIGFLLSIEALKTELGIESKISQSFCNAIPNADCGQIINSTKNKWLQKIKISDISFWFFASQLLAIFVFFVSQLSSQFFSIMIIGLALSLPITLYSIYFQYKIEKKWCPICLSIIGVVYLEFIFLLFLHNDFQVNISSLIIFSSIFSFIAGLVYLLKPVFIEKKDISEKYLKQLRFSRNYEVFKNTLLKSETQFFEKEYIVIGNRESKHRISIVTSPFCGYCKEAHHVLDNIFTRFGNDIAISIRFNYDENSSSKDLYLRLGEIYETKGDQDFVFALKNWFENKNLDNWLNKFGNVENAVSIEEKLIEITKENKEKGLNFTPNLFLNQYNYPKQYDRENLEYFIADWLEDEEL